MSSRRVVDTLGPDCLKNEWPLFYLGFHTEKTTLRLGRISANYQHKIMPVYLVIRLVESSKDGHRQGLSI